MNRITAIICVFALIAVPCISHDAQGANDDAVWLYEVMPAGSFEAVTIFNANSVKINLKNYYLDDGEGTVRFTSDLFIDAKQCVTIASAAPEPWFTGRTVYLFGTYGIVAKSFILADAGDEVALKKASNNQAIDTFVYGNGDTKAQGWKGDAFGRIPAGKMAVRSSAFDTDTANDWSISVIGRTGETATSSGQYDSMVTPFVFPDSRGDPVFRALEKAKTEVLISVYLLDHREIVSLLMMLLSKGVTVVILLEGSPAGGVPDTEIRYMTALHEKGASIFIMKGNGVYKRYDLNHSKYAVIDSGTTVITSENWREGSFNGNRGWGAVVDDREYSEYMRKIFLADCDPSRYDVFPLKEIYPSAAPISVPSYNMRTGQDHEAFPASVRPVLSPDFSFEHLKKEMLSASDRIYAEQMSIQYAWTDISMQSPVSWSLTAAGNGVDVRILADVTFDTDNGGANNYTAVSVINGTNGLQARTINGSDTFGLTHNKGVIIDDTVWVSSINWSNAAFTNNREVAVQISSKDVADYFASYFLLDWGDDAEMHLIVDVRGGVAGEATVLDASSSSFPAGTMFGWDLNGDGIVDRTGIKIAAALPEGTHCCALIATDGSGVMYVYEFTVTVHSKDNNSDLFEPYIKYAPILAIMLAIFAAAVIRRMRGRYG